MNITKKFLNDNSTKNKAWTKAQLEVIGIEWPPKKGWQNSVIGLNMTSEQVVKFKEASLIVKPKHPKRAKHGVVQTFVGGDLTKIESLEKRVEQLESILNRMLAEQEK